jgi:hypothetical protein
MRHGFGSKAGKKPPNSHQFALLRQKPCLFGRVERETSPLHGRTMADPA